jgi:hypothetical protein
MVEDAVDEKDKRIAELEAERDKYISGYINHEGELRALQAKLDKVRELPEKWRIPKSSSEYIEHYAAHVNGCADELQSALGDEDE